MGVVTVVRGSWDRLQRALLLNSRAAQESVAKVGILAAKGGDQTVAGTSITMIELAAIHEFGSPEAGIVQRSFIRSTFAREAQAMAELCGKLVTKVIYGMPLERALGILGAWGAAQIKTTIRERNTTGPEDQANRPSTIAKKGSSTPLVDTGRLINAISWSVWLGANRDAEGKFTGGKVAL